MHWRTFRENMMKIDIERAVAIFRKTPKRMSCNLKNIYGAVSVAKCCIQIADFLKRITKK
jgi:hypothetical protein